MVTVRDAIGAFMFVEKNVLLNDVNNNGAASPVTLAIARIIPVRIPVAAPL